MAQASTEPKPLLPALQPFYEAVIPLSWLVVRVAVGWNLVVHGYPKLLNGPSEAFLKAYADLGYTPPAFWFWISMAAAAAKNRVNSPRMSEIPPSVSITTAPTAAHTRSRASSSRSRCPNT